MVGRKKGSTARKPGQRWLDEYVTGEDPGSVFYVTQRKRKQANGETYDRWEKTNQGWEFRAAWPPLPNSGQRSCKERVKPREPVRIAGTESDSPPSGET